MTSARCPRASKGGCEVLVWYSGGHHRVACDRPAMSCETGQPSPRCAPGAAPPPGGPREQGWRMNGQSADGLRLAPVSAHGEAVAPSHGPLERPCRTEQDWLREG